MLVFRSIHVAAELVRSEPELLLEADVRGVVRRADVTFYLRHSQAKVRDLFASGERKRAKEMRRQSLTSREIRLQASN